MKRFLTLCLMAFAVFCALSGCGCDNGENIGLVLVNDSNTTIFTVVVDYADQTSGVQNANSSPLKRGESFGFEVGGEYPVTVAVYDQIVDDFTQRGMLAQIVIREAPPEGERWYVTAQDGGNNGLALTVDSGWPEGV